MPTPTASTEPSLPADRREIRARIARLRRRIDGHLHRAERHGRRLLSWRTYLTRYPLYAVAAAVGVGLLVSARLKPNVAGRWIGRYVLRGVKARLLMLLAQEFVGFWDFFRSGSPAGDAAGSRVRHGDRGDRRRRRANMPRRDRSLLADVKEELGGLTSDVREMLRLR